MRAVGLFALVLLSTVTACHSGGSGGAPGGLDGKVLFESVCARCHAVDGKGDPTAKLQLGVPDMTDPAWQAAHSDEVIKLTVHEGSKSKKMPALGDYFSDAQLDEIIKHVRGFAVR